MKIYQIKNDYQYWTLLPTTGTAFFADREMFKTRPMREKWTCPSIYVEDPLRTVRGDFMSLGCAGTFLFDQTVRDHGLDAILEEGGEVLPAKLDGHDAPIFFFNALACYNCLDHANCRPVLQPGKAAVEVETLAFHPSRIGDSNIFKVPERFWNEIFVLSGRDAPGDEFYAEYHRLNLKGLEFKEVWNDESE